MAIELQELITSQSATLAPVSISEPESASLTRSRSYRSVAARYAPFLATVIDQGWVSCANFVTVVLIGRALGPTTLGTFTLLWSVGLFLNVVQQSFVIAPMLTLRSKHTDASRRQYFSSCARAQLIFAVGASLLVFFAFEAVARLGRFHEVTAKWAFPLALSCAAFQIQEFCRRLLQAVKRPMWALLCDCAAYGLQVGIIAVLALRHVASINAILWAMFFGWAVGCMFLLLAAENLRSTSSSLNRVLKVHGAFGGSLAASNLFQWVGAYGGLYLAAAVLNAEAVGNVRAIINIVAPLNVFAVGIQTFLSIEAADLFYRGGLRPMQRMLLRYAAGFLGLGVLVGCAFSLISKQAFGLLFGPAYSIKAVWILAALASVLFGALFGFLVVYFRTIERTALAAVSAGIATIVSLVGTKLLLPVLLAGAVLVGLLLNQAVAFTLGIILSTGRKRASCV